MFVCGSGEQCYNVYTFMVVFHDHLSPSSTEEPLSEHRDNEYFRAEQLGRTGAPCERIFPECVHSLLDIFTGVHDGETNMYVTNGMGDPGFPATGIATECLLVWPT